MADSTQMIDIEQLTEVSYRFTELGAAIEAVSSQNTRSFEDMLDGLRTLQSVTDSMSRDTISSIASSLGANVIYAPQITQMYMNSFLKTDEVFKSLNSSMADFQKVFMQAATGAVAGGPAGVGATGMRLPHAKVATTSTGSKKKEVGLVEHELKSVGTTLRGWASKLKIPLPGALIAGGMIWAALGFKRTQRIAAEAGEVKNIFVGAVDSAVKGMVEKGTSYISGLQEELQRAYGIVKGETQGVIRSFIDGGVSIEQMLKKVDDSLGLVGESTVTFTLGLDKFFEIPGGASAKLMTKMMADYGYSMDKARDKLTTLMFAGKESGIGTMQFVKNVEEASSELKQFGFDMEAVADLALTMQNHFERMGVPEQFAGKQAVTGLKQMASGLANMSEDWQVFFAEKLGYGMGLAGRQAMMQSQTRVARGGGYEDLMKLYRQYATVALEVNRGNEVNAMYMLETSMGLGRDGAYLAIEIMKKINSGDVISAKELAKKHETELRDSIITEKEKRSSWELHMNDWMDAISIMGEGILAGFANLLAQLVVWGSSLPALIINYFQGNTKANEALLQKIDQVTATMTGGWDTFANGLSMLAEVAPKMGLDVLGTSAMSFKSAIDYVKEMLGLQTESPADPSLAIDPWGVWSNAPAAPSSPFAGSAGTFASPIIQTVTIPARQAGAYAVPAPSAQDAFSAGMQGSSQPWAGGKLSISSDGVDAAGNIRLSLVGNCPRCGLVFGEAPMGYIEQPSSFFSGSDQPDAGKVRVVNPNIGVAQELDPTTTSGMQLLSQMSRGGKARRGGVATENLDPRLGNILKQVSEAFPGKAVKVFRGATEKGGTDEHSKGKAMDIGVEGEDPADVFRFLQKNVKGGGKGYYPNRPFVHVDVRDDNAVWVDPSKAGEKGTEALGGSAATSWFKKNRPEEPAVAVAEEPAKVPES